MGHSKVDEIMMSRFSHVVKRRYRPQEALQTSERKREGRKKDRRKRKRRKKEKERRGRKEVVNT